MHSRAESIEIISEKIKGMRTAMLVTMNEFGMHVGRPMSMQEIDFDGVVWFMTSKDSDKIKEIEANPQVAVLFGDSSGVKFVSLSGTAKISDDKAKVKQFWSDMYNAWFDGVDDPSITLIKVQIARAEYWDTKGGKAGAYIDMAEAAITGKGMDNQENEILVLQ